MKKIIRFLAISLVILSGTETLFCQTLDVPQNYEDIQSAIDAANKGDTVLVDIGRYYENINFRGKSIVVASRFILERDTSFISKTIIDGSKPKTSDTASCVLMINAEDSNAVLIGFTLTNGKGTPIKGYVEGGGILMDSSTAVIQNNIIINNSVVAGGGGIAAWHGKPRILNNVIINNYGGYAAGIVLNWCDGIIKNNLIYHNIKTGSSWLTGGLMIWDTPGHPLIENNTIVGNISSTRSGGVSVTAGSNPVFVNNIIWGNCQVSGDQVTGIKENMFNYCNSELKIAGEGNIHSFPLFKTDTFTLAPGSPCIDSGNADIIYNDKENELSPGQALSPSQGTIRNDMGAFGGPGTFVLNSFHVEDIYVSKNSIDFKKLEIGDSASVAFEILNIGTSGLSVDSIAFSEASLNIASKNGSPVLHSFKNDSVYLKWKPVKEGELLDTIRIYHSCKNIENPKKISVKGKVDSLEVPVNSIENSDNNEALIIAPNPCTSGFNVTCLVKEESFINLSLLTINGQKIAQLVYSQINTGDYTYEFGRGELPGGVYILHLESNGKTTNKKLIVE